MRRRLAALLVALLVATACSGDRELTNLAVATCDQLEDSIVLTAGLIVQAAILSAEDMGYSGPELGDKMWEECPGIMLALENVGEEQERRDNLINEVTLSLDRCGADSATGTVRNNASVTVTVGIDVQFTKAGVLVESGFDLVSGLRPGQTGTWEARFFGDDYDRCRADLSSVYED